MLRRGAGGCGGGAAAVGGFSEGLYREGETDGLPADAVLASLGCGNPLAVAELHDGERVLDLGSGGGIDVLLSARRVGPSGFVYGVDMTDDMLALARRNAAEAGALNVEFLKGHIEDVPLPGASVDVVISNCVINLSVDKPAVLAEMFRVLVPGGRIGISDIVAEDQMSPGGPGGDGLVCRVHRGGTVAGGVPGRAGGGRVHRHVGDLHHPAAPGMHRPSSGRQAGTVIAVPGCERTDQPGHGPERDLVSVLVTAGGLTRRSVSDG